MVTRPEKKRRSWALLLLLLPFIVLLIPPIYNYNNPELIGGFDGSALLFRSISTSL